MEEYEFNPCCCVGIRTGAVVISVFDLIYGALYIGRVFMLDYMINSHPDIYPNEIGSSKTHAIIVSKEMQSGNYALMSFSGILLLGLGIRSATHWELLVACNFWLVARAYLTIVFSMLMYYMFHSAENSMYHVYGGEVAVNVVVHLYFFPIVIMFTRILRTEIKIADLGIISRKNKPQVLLRIPPAPQMTDLDEVSLHEMSPELFLGVVAKEKGQKSVQAPEHHSDEDWTEERYRRALVGTVPGTGARRLNPAAFVGSSQSSTSGKEVVKGPISGNPSGQQQQKPKMSVLKPAIGMDSGSSTKIAAKGHAAFSTGTPSIRTIDSRTDEEAGGLILNNPGARRFKQLFLDNEYIVILPHTAKSKSKPSIPQKK